MKESIRTKFLTTLEDLQNLKKGDHVVCKFYRNIPGYTNVRFKTFEVYENNPQHKEIILERKNNIYFNYEMFLRNESHLESIMLVYPSAT